MNFLRYPLTSKNFFLNQKNPHRAKFGHPKLSGGVHPEPHLMQGSIRPDNPASNLTNLCRILQPFQSDESRCGKITTGCIILSQLMIQIRNFRNCQFRIIRFCQKKKFLLCQKHQTTIKVYQIWCKSKIK